MLGAIAGDIIGSQFEFKSFKSKEFTLFTKSCRFTDDSLMTLAIGEAFMLRAGHWHDEDFQQLVISRMVKMGRAHQGNNWGMRFYKWFMENPAPYRSIGNGAAMRVSSVGWISRSEEDVKYFSRLVTEVSHNHPEALKAAEAVSMAIYLAREGASMAELRARMISYYPKIAKMTVDNMRPRVNMEDGSFITCPGSVPHAIVCFLESEGFEDTVRNAVSLGGDADTQSAIAGSIAEAYYGVPRDIESRVLEYLTTNLKSIYFAFDTVKLPRRGR